MSIILGIIAIILFLFFAAVSIFSKKPHPEIVAALFFIAAILAFK